MTVKESVEAVKKHVRKHKTAYIAGVSAIAGAGITLLVMRSTTAQRGVGEDNAQRGLINAASRVFVNKQTINVTTVVDREGRGHPGWPVRNVETGRIFLSQREAATTFGISEGALSGQLQGKYPDVAGLTFERISLPA